ncbi:MAG: lipopolysaccharide biosynthesis protein [Sphingopyxis sp.]|nr:lipopolysaccharide biosynthesis protein [Sphingopyxis sp.]
MKASFSKVTSLLSSIPLFSMRDMVWQYVASLGVAIFGALFILAAGRVLGPSEFGIYAIAAAVPTVVNSLFDYRIQEVSIVVLSENGAEEDAARDVRSLFLFDLVSRIIAFIVSIPAGMLILNALGFVVDPIVPLLAALVIFLAKVGNSLAVGVMRLSGNIQQYALLQSFDWAIRLAGGAALYFFATVTIESTFLVQLPSALLINLWTLVLARRIAVRRYGSQVADRAGFRNLVEFFRSRSKLLLSSQSISAVDTVVKELDTLICGIFLSAHNVAIYKITKSIAVMAWRCVDPVFVVILPNIAAYVADGRMDELSAIVKKATIYLFLAAIAVFLGIWVISYPFTAYLLGPSYSDVPSIIPFMSIWIVVALPFVWTHSVAIASGNAELQALSGMIGAVIGVVALISGSASWSIYGAALGLSVAYSAYFVISYILLKKKKIITW